MEVREAQLQNNKPIELTPPSSLEEQEINSIYEEVDNKGENGSKEKNDIEELNSLLGDDKSKTFVETVEDAIKNLLSIFKKQSDTKDGVIDYTKQAKNGDCWLLSGVNSLTYSEKGREILKNAFEYKEDSTVVHLEGVGDYTVTNEELEAAKSDGHYATGDDDMVIMELAIGKVLNEFKDKNMDFENFRSSKSIKFEPDGLVTSNGFTENAIYFITGKEPQKIKDKEQMAELVDELSNNHSDMALATSIKDRDTLDITAKTIDGKEVSLSSRHAYAIKGVTDEAVLVVNPWDASQTIEFDKETFVETFDDIITCDLSEKNPQTFNIIYPKINEDGTKTFLYDASGSRFADSDGKEVTFDNISRTYSADNVLLEETFYKDGEECLTQTYNEKGEIVDMVRTK